MRRKKYRTLLDPMERSYGSVVTSLIYLASLLGDILWSASILAALGKLKNILKSNLLANNSDKITVYNIVPSSFGRLFRVSTHDIDNCIGFGLLMPNLCICK